MSLIKARFERIWKWEAENELGCKYNWSLEVIKICIMTSEPQYNNFYIRSAGMLVSFACFFLNKLSENEYFVVTVCDIDEAQIKENAFHWN